MKRQEALSALVAPAARDPCPLNAATISNAFLFAVTGPASGVDAGRQLAAEPGPRRPRLREAAQQVSPIESVTIDIVAMLFDFIFNDDELPATVNRWSDGCRSPCSRSPCSTRGFRQPAASARRFLDSITGA